MDQAKAIEFINKSLIADYLQKLLHVKMEKLTLFTVFPYTAAPNYSDPQHLIMIPNVEKLAAYSKFDLN